jgi:Ca-activated chloride channel family protein
MSFIWPPALLSILLIPIGLWLYGFVGGRRRRSLARAYGSAALARGESGGGSGAGSGRVSVPLRNRARFVPAALTVGGLVLMALALARPQAVVALPRQQGTVILAFDVSGSMAATDVKPTRIAAAQAAAKDFVANQPSGISIGVVAFSDSGVSVQTPSTDSATIDNAIDRLTPKKGTSLAAGITASLDAIAVANRGPYANNYYSLGSAAPTATPTPVPAGYHAPAVIVLLTDGENNENPDPMTAAQVAANQGVRIFTVGLGSAAGTDLDVNGIHVHTTLNAAELQQISQVTGGTYYSATDAQQLDSVYSHLDTQLVATPELTELTAVFAGASALMLLAGAFGSMLWLGRMP